MGKGVMPMPFKGKCLKCKKIMLYEPEDKIPMCDECKHKAKKEFEQKIRPDSGPVELFSRFIEPEPEEKSDDS